MKVFSMALRRAPERCVYMENQLKGLGLDYEIVDSVDFKAYTEEEFKQFYNEEAKQANPYLTFGGIACGQSHIKIFKRIIEQNLPCALVLEDDAALPANIKEVLALIEKEIGEDEIIALSYYTHSGNTTLLSNKGRKKLGRGLDLAYPVDIMDLASTMAFVIGSKVAKKMINSLSPVAFAPDKWGHHYELGVFSSLRCVYPVLVKEAPFQTTIDYIGTDTFLRNNCIQGFTS